MLKKPGNGSGRVGRMQIEVRGLVQGVGFRPFVWRLATELGLSGWVRNSPQGVQIEVEGDAHRLHEFLRRLGREKPDHAVIDGQTHSILPAVGYSGFRVEASEQSGERTARVLPDIATCPECVREIFDPANRRYRYPFANCTNCGPRYSIIGALPYDRVNTTMRAFPMCAACREEYDNPADRRFHAQPNACPDCGPHLELWDVNGKVLSTGDDALHGAADAVRQGMIVALKGLGGFLLLVDARNAEATDRLRKRKLREEKPLALLYPDLQRAEVDCEIAEAERELLQSPVSPIVLLRRRTGEHGSEITPSVAPRNPYLGIMLPYTPLHHLLMVELGFPVVATSGNLTDEPICTDEREALIRLERIADVFLVHNRPIARPVDDSVVHVVLGRPQVLRCARGYAPLPIEIDTPLLSCLAVGAHLKNTVAIARDHQVVLSQHIGDLVTPQAYDAFESTITALAELYEIRPEAVVCDSHPDYVSTKFAENIGLPLARVQHHYAHVLSCMAEHHLSGPVLGVSWDGTGWGPDGTVWGGEFLLVDEHDFTRVAHLRTFRLPGGEHAIREPRRCALGVLYEMFGTEREAAGRFGRLLPFEADELKVLLQMLARSINAPLTSSAGRLFDAVASLLNLCQITRFEGQAAMQVEFAAHTAVVEDRYPFQLQEEDSVYVADWEPIIRGVLDDVAQSLPGGHIAAKFHNALADIIAGIAARVSEQQVVLTGGCFQNRYLTELAVCRLEAAGFTVFRHERVPPNDGGIALGQIAALARQSRIKSGTERQD